MSLKTAPLLVTHRLILKNHQLHDYEDCAKLWSNPIVTRYIGGQPLTEEACWAKFLRTVGHWSMMGFGFWVIRDKSTGQFIGEIGLADHKRSLQPDFAGIPEMGWALNPDFHGQGYAKEAAFSILDWADHHLQNPKTVCLIDPDNSASLRLAEKLGYQLYAQAEYQGTTNLLLQRWRG